MAEVTLVEVSQRIELKSDNLLYPLSLRDISQSLGFSDPISLRKLVDYTFSIHTYELTVKTKNVQNAGTDANVFLFLRGTWAIWNQFQLQNSTTNGDPFEKGKTDMFYFSSDFLGPNINFLNIRHDNSGIKPGWNLEYIVAKDIESNLSWFFKCDRWLSSSKKYASDCAIDLYLELDGKVYPNPGVAHICNTDPQDDSQDNSNSDNQNNNPGDNTPPSLIGVKELHIYNCNYQYHTINIWIRELPNESWTEKGSINHQYDSYGTCPTGEPIVIPLQDNIWYELVLVDPKFENCGQNDPTIIGCRNVEGLYLGSKDGIVVPVFAP